MLSNYIIVIPTFNEEKTIEKVIINSKEEDNIVIIDDGSSDKTVEISKKYRVNIVKHKTNLGYEASILSGFEYAKKNDIKYVIFIDADEEIPIENLTKIKNLLFDDFKIATGIRNKKNRYLEVFFSFVSELLWSVKDPMCGLKGYNIENISVMSNKFLHKSFATEILFKLLKANYSIVQFPIKVNTRSSNSKVGNSLYVQFIILRSILLCIWIKISKLS